MSLSGQYCQLYNYTIFNEQDNQLKNKKKLFKILIDFK